jgi:hypothetical protein
MKKANVARTTLVVLLLLALSAGFAMAQSGDDDDRPERAEVVYNNEYLQKRLAETEEQPTVYTNRSLSDAPAEPAATPAAAASGAYTNKDLPERVAGAPAATPEDQAPAEQAEPAVDAEEAATPAAEPTLSAEQRAQRINDIDEELKRLEKRMLAIRNPLLAGTDQPSDEERAQEQGMDNNQRLQQTEDKIDELRTLIEDLRSRSE